MNADKARQLTKKYREEVVPEKIEQVVNNILLQIRNNAERGLQGIQVSITDLCAGIQGDDIIERVVEKLKALGFITRTCLDTQRTSSGWGTVVNSTLLNVNW